LIQVSEVCKRYRRVEALGGITLAVARGETVVVLGPSGCGKTTLLRLIAGLETPNAGEVHIEGAAVSSPRRLVEPHQRRLTMIFQDLALWPHLTAIGNVAFGLRGNGRSRKEIQASAKEALRRVRLSDHGERYPHQLSGGERQRLAIARAVAGSPSYMLMDEPFSSLDPLLKRQMIGLLKELRESLELGVLYVTHNLDEALALGDRIVLMTRGQVVGSLNTEQTAVMTPLDLLGWYEACVGGKPDL